MLLREEKLLLALLRFGRDATIHEHAGESEAIVVCLEGDGYTSVENESAQAGQRVRWPAGTRHRLWTEGSTMLTLMVERPPAAAP